MDETTKALIKMIIEGKTGEEYKKLLAGLTESERKEIVKYEKKFKEAKLAEKIVENFFGIFKIKKMKNKIIVWWHQCGAFITILLAYTVATGSAIYGVEIARKYNDVFWLVFAIMVGLLVSLFIGIVYQEFTIEELLKEDDND